MLHLKKGDTIALVANSNPQTNPKEIAQLCTLLQTLDLKVAVSPLLFDSATTNSEAKAQLLQTYFADPVIKMIFDISGGNRANSILPFLDYHKLAQTPKPFFGYSDLTAVLNTLVSNGQPAELFQLKTLLWDQTGQQLEKFRRTFFEQANDLYESDWRFIQGTNMSGTVVGGNIRCFLKLAGTPYLPDLTDKILFLESFGGNLDALFSMFHHLRQLPNFSKLNGILLGTFTDYQKAATYPLEQLLQDVLQSELPLAKTEQIGHGKTSNALTLGKVLTVTA